MARLANLDDDMTNEPTLGVYGAREEAEATAKALGHTLVPLWTNYLGELHKECHNCRHRIIVTQRKGIVGLSGRASYLRCGEEPTFTHQVTYTKLDHAGLRVTQAYRTENLEVAQAFARTQPGSVIEELNPPKVGGLSRD